MNYIIYEKTFIKMLTNIVFYKTISIYMVKLILSILIEMDNIFIAKCFVFLITKLYIQTFNNGFS